MTIYTRRKGILASGYVPFVEHVAAAQDATDQTTYTFSSVALGRPHATRRIIVDISSRKTSTTINVSSVSVAGISATEILDNSWGSDNNEIGFWIATVPAGATGSVVVTFSGSVDRCLIDVFRGINLKSGTPTDTGINSSTSASSLSASIDVLPGGYILALASYSGVGTTVWTNITEVSEHDAEISSSAAIVRSATTQTVNVQADFSSSSIVGLAVCAFR